MRHRLDTLSRWTLSCDTDRYPFPALQTELLSVAHGLADVAHPIAMQYFRKSGQGVENKRDGDFDPVTVAHRGIEQAMRKVLAVRRPQDGILGEEYGASEGSIGLTWVLDPIDGTRAYISDLPTWGGVDCCWG